MSKRGRCAGGAEGTAGANSGRWVCAWHCLERVRRREGDCAASMEEQERGGERWGGGCCPEWVRWWFSSLAADENSLGCIKTR